MRRRLGWLAAVAVVAAGSATASAASASVAAGPHWRVQPTPNRAAPSNMLEGVSCTSGTFCMAVGTSGPISMRASLAGRASWPLAMPARRFDAKPAAPRALAERWDGTRWRIVATPSPVGSPSTGLLGVTCLSRRACTAVGAAVAGKITVPLVERWNGSRWSIAPAPRPPKDALAGLQGVSCPTSRECMAVGSDFNASLVSSGFAERWNGSRWRLAGQFRLGGGVMLTSVSCPSATRCTAVGAAQDQTLTFPLAERWIAGRWRRQATPGIGTLDSVYCPAFSDCTAVGSQPVNPPPQTAVLAMRWNGRKWNTQSAPEPPTTTEAALLGVFCTSVASCEAVGSATLATMNTVTIADRWNGTNWKLEPTPLTAALVTQFNSVWCGAHVPCRAAGLFRLSSPPGDKTLVERR